MKKIFTVAIFFLLASTAAAQIADGRVKVTDIRVESNGETVDVAFTAEVAPKAVKRNHTLILAPVIAGEGFCQSLPPIVVQGKSSRVARERREWVARQTAGNEDAVYTVNGRTVTMTATVPLQKWMFGSGLVLESVEGGCCAYDKLNDEVLAENIIATPAPQPVAVIEPEPEAEPVWIPRTVADSLSTAFTFVVPASEFDPDEPFTIYDEERENSLIIYFRVGRTDIDAIYMDNALTMANLSGVINMIVNSEGSSVSRIVVAGFSSPDGSFQHNDRMAFDRAVSVKKFIMEATGVDDHKIRAFNGSVDWRGLRVMVEKSDLPEKHQVLSIIDNTPIWDSRRQVGRHGELMRLNGGSTYRYLLAEYFPYLRNGAFIKVYYENK